MDNLMKLDVESLDTVSLYLNSGHDTLHERLHLFSIKVYFSLGLQIKWPAYMNKYISHISLYTSVIDNYYKLAFILPLVTFSEAVLLLHLGELVHICESIIRASVQAGSLTVNRPAVPERRLIACQTGQQKECHTTGIIVLTLRCMLRHFL